MHQDVTDFLKELTVSVLNWGAISKKHNPVFTELNEVGLTLGCATVVSDSYTRECQAKYWLAIKDSFVVWWLPDNVLARSKQIHGVAVARLSNRALAWLFCVRSREWPEF